MLAAGLTHHTVYATQLVDIDRHVLLDVVQNRSAASVSTWFAARTRYFCDHIEVAAIDPHAGYFKALSASVPRATVTIDVFHAVKLANAAVDDVRRRVQRETLGHRGRNEDPLYGIRQLLTPSLLPSVFGVAASRWCVCSASIQRAAGERLFDR